MRAFLDFEASSLAKQSYPIEVAWVFEDGQAESWLIRPLPAWTDWDDRAAAIHGISRAELESGGAPPAEVAARLLSILGGRDVYASSPSWDGKWLSVLLRAGGLPRHALRLKDTDEGQLETALEAFAGVPESDWRDAAARGVVERVRAAAGNLPIAHRALPDARHELQLWLDVRKAAQWQALAMTTAGRVRR